MLPHMPLISVVHSQLRKSSANNRTPTVGFEHVWAEASWTSVEPVYGPRDEINRFYAKQCRPLLVLL